VEANGKYAQCGYGFAGIASRLNEVFDRLLVIRNYYPVDIAKK